VIFGDTSGLFCFLHRDEPQHEDAVEFVRADGRLLTHSLVVAELVALAQVRGVPRRPTLDFVTELHHNAQVVMAEADRDLRLMALELLGLRQDKEWSLCDAVSFLVMEMHQVGEALTTDHHFEQAGFVRLLPGTID
jgi:uncharacterized protein